MAKNFLNALLKNIYGIKIRAVIAAAKKRIKFSKIIINEVAVKSKSYFGKYDFIKRICF